MLGLLQNHSFRNNVGFWKYWTAPAAFLPSCWHLNSRGLLSTFTKNTSICSHWKHVCHVTHLYKHTKQCQWCLHNMEVCRNTSIVSCCWLPSDKNVGKCFVLIGAWTIRLEPSAGPTLKVWGRFPENVQICWRDWLSWSKVHQVAIMTWNSAPWPLIFN